MPRRDRRRICWRYRHRISWRYRCRMPRRYRRRVSCHCRHCIRWHYGGRRCWSYQSWMPWVVISDVNGAHNMRKACTYQVQSMILPSAQILPLKIPPDLCRGRGGECWCWWSTVWHPLILGVVWWVKTYQTVSRSSNRAHGRRILTFVGIQPVETE